MRALPSIAFLITTVAGLVAGPAVAEDPDTEPETQIVLHVDEGAPAGRLVADLAELLDAAQNSRYRLISGSDEGFEINAEGQLSVAASARLNHEDNPSHRLRLEIVTPVPADPIHDRFFELLNKTAAAGEFLELSRADRRVVRIDVIVDDRPEPPQVMEAVFPAVDPARIAPGGDIGRVIAVDPDVGDRLQFQLLNTEPLLTIDPDSGLLSLRPGATLPDIVRIRTTVEATDTDGLSDSREIVIPLQRYPKPFTHTGQEQPAIVSAGNGSETASRGSASAGGDSQTSPSKNVATVEKVSNKPAGDSTPAGADASATTTAHVDNGAGKEPRASQPSSSVPSPPAAAATDGEPRQLSGQNNRTDRTAWVLICVICVLLLVALCWGPLQKQCRKLVLEPEAADAASQDGDPAEQTLRRAETSPTVSPGRPSSSASNAITGHGGKKDTRELHSLLASLHESYGPSPQDTSTSGGTAAGEHDTGCAKGQQAGPDPSAIDEERFMIYDDAPEGARSESATATARMTARETAETSSPARSGPVKGTSGEPLQHEKSERAQMEEFRQIARTYTRADIDRSRREQMRIEWMSRGAAVASSTLTGGICLFTNCFGDISVPIGTVLLAVAAALLMKRSLYSDDHRSHSAGSTESEPLSTSRSAPNAADS